VLISSPKEQNVALGATKMTHFKKKFRNHKKSPHAHPKINVKKYENNHHDHKRKSKKPHVPKEKFNGNCNYCAIYGHKESHCFKKKRKENSKGKDNVNKFKRKKNKKGAYVCDFYSKSHNFTNDWVVNLGCTNHMSFERNKFENFHKHRKNAIVIRDNSMLEVQGIGIVLMHGKVIEGVLFVPKLGINLLSVIQIARKGYTFEFNLNS